MKVAGDLVGIREGALGIARTDISMKGEWIPPVHF